MDFANLLIPSVCCADADDVFDALEPENNSDVVDAIFNSPTLLNFAVQQKVKEMMAQENSNRWT